MILMARKKIILSFLILAIFLISVCVCADEVSSLLNIAQGQEYEKSARFQEAIAEYEKALQENPRSRHAYMSLGHIYQYQLNDKKKAISYYEKGLAYTPNDFGMSLNCMYAYFDVDDFDNAMRIYEMLSSMDHRFVHTFPRDALNKIFRNMNEQEVINFCKKYLSINPGDNILREKLSEIYMEKKDYYRARPEFEARLNYSKETDNVGPIYFGLAMCDYYLGQYQNSMDYLKKAKAAGEYVPDQYFDMVRERLVKY